MALDTDAVGTPKALAMPGNDGNRMLRRQRAERRQACQNKDIPGSSRDTRRIHCQCALVGQFLRHGKTRISKSFNQESAGGTDLIL